MKLDGWPTFIVAVCSMVASGASAYIAHLALKQSKDTTELRTAVGKIAVLAEQSKRQANALERQSARAGFQLDEMKRQTLFIASNAKTAQDQISVLGAQTGFLKRQVELSFKPNIQAILPDTATIVSSSANKIQFRLNVILKNESNFTAYRMGSGFDITLARFGIVDPRAGLAEQCHSAAKMGKITLIRPELNPHETEKWDFSATSDRAPENGLPTWYEGRLCVSYSSSATGETYFERQYFRIYVNAGAATVFSDYRTTD